MGQLHLSGFTLANTSDDWVVIHLKKDGAIDFDEATPYLKKGNFAHVARFHGQDVQTIRAHLDEAKQ